MARTVFTGGRVFDGTGSAFADADVVIEDGRIRHEDRIVQVWKDGVKVVPSA